MRKKLITLTIVVVISALANIAFGFSNPNGYGNGLYFGLDVGRTSLEVDKDTNVAAMPPFFPAVIYKRSNSITGPFGGVFLGLGHNWHNFYLAAETEADDYDANDTIRNNLFQPGAKIREKLRYTYLAALRAGYFVTPRTLLFIRVGGVRSKFRSSSNDGGLDGSSRNFNETIDGPLYGIGMEAMLSKHFALRGEYDRIDYDDFCKSSFSKSYNVKQTTNYSPDADEFRFGLAYYIN